LNEQDFQIKFKSFILFLNCPIFGEGYTSTEFLNIEFTSKYSGDYIFEILDVSGRIVGQESLNFSGTNIRETIDITRYESGTYLLRIRTDQTSHTAPFSVIR